MSGAYDGDEPIVQNGFQHGLDLLVPVEAAKSASNGGQVAGLDVHLVDQRYQFPGGLFYKSRVAGIAPVVLGRIGEQAVKRPGTGGRPEVEDVVSMLGQKLAQCLGTVEQLVGLFGDTCPHDGVAVSFDHSVGGDTYGAVVCDGQVENADGSGHGNHGHDSFLMRHFVVAVSPVGAGAPA